MPQLDAEPLVIPPPRADRPPLHANLLNVMQQANTTLAPLFPYMHPGAIVPTGALFIGGPGKDYGQFYHPNSAAEGTTALATPRPARRPGHPTNGGRAPGANPSPRDRPRPARS